MKRKKIAAGNWKMNTDIVTATALATGLNSGSYPDDVQLIIAPPFLYLPFIREILKSSRILIAAQNAHPAAKGAYTGEVSQVMLAEMGIDAVIIGHSERREVFGESNEFLREKLNAALENRLIPIFCCGEPLAIRKEGSQNSFVENQLKESLLHLDAEQIQKVIVAYEPIWAIGTGETASPQQAEDMHAHIRQLLTDQYGHDIADGISILYGGSVKPGNANELFGQPNVDGGLVGGASLDVDSFLAIANGF